MHTHIHTIIIDKLKEDDLDPYFIGSVERPNKTPRVLGAGSYGSVELLFIKGVKCAGKKIHDTLIETQTSNIRSQLISEVKLMCNLRHPNIVQFLGVTFLPGSKLPVLLMEYLPDNLDNFLENRSIKISLPIKLSILQDVARGLSYLHSMTPPVVHRDLTARNVLLTSSMVAKIADFGNSRIINPQKVPVTLTTAPGTTVYLPPEALNHQPKYNASIDSFAFGVLSLFTFTEEFPQPTAATVFDPETKALKPQTEVERRRKYIDELVSMFQDTPAVSDLVTRCLSNNPGERPTADAIRGDLEELQLKNPDPYGEMDKLKLLKTIDELKEGEKEEKPSNILKREVSSP